MNRFTKYGLALLLAVTFTACDEGTPPPVEPPDPPTPVGTISGAVTIEGTAASGITATLSSGATTTTGSGGNFAFSGVEAGTYTVTVSGYPEDATFAEVTQSATIATDGQNVQLTFAGEYIRSSAVVGNVVAADAMMSGGDGQPETLAGVTVTLGGEHAMGETMETDETGGFAFTGLRAGTYTVTISDFPEDVSFETVSVEIEVDVGDVGQADFTGHFIRTSAVEGQVIIEGEGLAGVTVTLSGGPADESFTMMTDADGMYRFDELRPGDYTVSIADFDPRDYEFAATSQDVSVDLDETGTVSFTGVLLRTSGISGRVSVEGMGLEGIAVTLSGAADDTTTTDAGGQYAFAGLAAGDYTVSIAVESDAYVFGSMSTDRTVGDDESAIVNFEGAHATTASVSGMLFIDEATKNDMHDEGEHPLAHAGIPVALVGPGVSEQRLSATNETGAFSFTGLRAGAYQLVVLIDGAVATALAANSLAYGGPGAGYEIALGVGAAASQAIPFDITHTTVNFSVSLKHGDERGAALPGAMVALSSGQSGTTGDDGSVAIKVARAGVDGNMVTASVTHADYEDGGGGSTEVSWDPQMFATAASNANDIVNLNVDVTFSGATITTEYGGGKALGGWALSVMHGDSAVDGAPEKLDEDGNAAFKTTVEADDLPATFIFAAADDQDDDLDGGESYQSSGGTYTHTGLSLAGTMDAGAIEVRYTTQTLIVSVYREVDQVPGFTGNIGTKDISTTAGVSLDIRHQTPSNRRGTFDPEVWKWDTSGSDRTVWVDKGVYTLRGLPADANVFVLADEEADNVEVLYPDNLAAFENPEANGIMGGAFGSEGGFHHTVGLCPLEKVDPTGQDFGDCGSFAFVHNYKVAAHVKKMAVEMDDDDGFEPLEEINVPDVELAFSPVEGKNLAGDEESLTTLEKAVRSGGEASSSSAWDDEVDEREDLYFGRMAEGVYSVSVSDNWGVTVDGDKVSGQFRLEEGVEGDVGDLTGVDGPFHPGEEDGVYFEVRPTTTILYGLVEDEDGDPIEEATVTVNGVSTETDIDGRYIVEFSAKRSTRNRNSDELFISASADGHKTQVNDPDASSRAKEDIERAPEFTANDPQRQDITLPDADLLATVTGTVTDKDGDPVSGVDITVTNQAGENVLQNETRNCEAERNDENIACRKTGDDGTYTLSVLVKEDDEDYTITPSKTRYYFDNTDEVERLEVGDEEDGVDFEALRQSRIRGSVRGPDGGMEGVTVTATGDRTFSDETNANGRFTIWVDGDDRYDVAAAPKDGYTFSPPEDANGLRVDDDETHEIGVFTAATFAVTDLEAMRDEDADGNPDGQLTVTWTAGTVPTGHVVTYQASTISGADSASLGDEVASDADPQQATGSAPSEGEFMVVVWATSDNGTSTDDTDDKRIRRVFTVDPINPTANLTSAGRNSDNADQLDLAWTAKTTSNTNVRIVVEVEVAGRNEWLVSTASTSSTDRSAEIDLTSVGAWNRADGSGTSNVTAAMLEKAFKVAVESVQGTASDDNPWKRSNVRDVKAKS